MINILFATAYTGLGGGETSLLALVARLDPARFRPHLLVPREGQLTRVWRARGWDTHITHWRGATTYFIPSVWGRFPITGRIVDVIRENNIDIIHSDYHTLPFAVYAGERANIPVVWTCHGWWFRPKFWQREFFQRPAATFAVSKHVRDGFLGDPPFMSPKNVELLPLGVDTDRFTPDVDGSGVRVEAGIASDAPLVAMIARFQDVKGHDVFQAMVKRVAGAIPEARFIVAGENVHGIGADEAYKARILAAHQADPILREKLTYLGFRSDVERVIAASDVVVCASHFESYGMVNVEAMACGKPVVSTRRGGPSETILDEETGYLVDAGDADSLAKRVIELLRDADLRAKIGLAGRARAIGHFSARATAERFAARVNERLTTENTEITEKKSF
jgi:glycosyltransferase involved in cell wall biosynthesis